MDFRSNLSALTEIRNVRIDESAIKAHVMRPEHTIGVISSKGREVAVPQFEFKLRSDWFYVFDVESFGKALHVALKDAVAGYVMQLRHHGRTIYTLEWNYAKIPADGVEGWTPAVRMHVASCSKLVTAIGMTKLLNDKGISYDTPIAPFLPLYWSKGSNVEKITFRHLMTHSSGFNTGLSDSDFEFMKARVAAGVTALGEYHYQNMNFGLCRILISTINGNIDPGTTFTIPFIANSNDVFWDYITIQSYAQYVRDFVFAPACVSGPTLDHPVPDALAYSFPVTGNGWNSGDLSSMSGGAGWHMSPSDLLSVMDAFRRRGTIMSAEQAQAMLDSGFGVDLQMSTPIGTLYNKNGLWQNGGNQVEQSLAYFLPRDMELVVLANSPIGSPGQFFRDVVTNIYVSCIVERPLGIIAGAPVGLRTTRER
jgi:CubicO group peptidase (beta-lactamase class C family)